MLMSYFAKQYSHALTIQSVPILACATSCTKLECLP